MLETERLLLVPIQEEHHKIINAEIRKSHAALSRWLFWVNPVPKIEETLSFCQDCYKKFMKNENLQLAIFNKEDRAFIGCIGVHDFNYKGEKNNFNIGYWIGSDYSGKGYMSEALKALCDYSFKELGATKLNITNDAENLPSNKLAKKAGFKLVETICKHIKNTDGELRDTNVYSLTP